MWIVLLGLAALGVYAYEKGLLASSPKYLSGVALFQQNHNYRACFYTLSEATSADVPIAFASAISENPTNVTHLPGTFSTPNGRTLSKWQADFTWTKPDQSVQLDPATIDPNAQFDAWRPGQAVPGAFESITPLNV